MLNRADLRPNCKAFFKAIARCRGQERISADSLPITSQRAIMWNISGLQQDLSRLQTEFDHVQLHQMTTGTSGGR